MPPTPAAFSPTSATPQHATTAPQTPVAVPPAPAQPEVRYKAAPQVAVERRLTAPCPKARQEPLEGHSIVQQGPSPTAVPGSTLAYAAFDPVPVEHHSPSAHTSVFAPSPQQLQMGQCPSVGHSASSVPSWLSVPETDLNETWLLPSVTTPEVAAAEERLPTPRSKGTKMPPPQ